MSFIENIPMLDFSLRSLSHLKKKKKNQRKIVHYNFVYAVVSISDFLQSGSDWPIDRVSYGGIMGSDTTAPALWAF